MAVFVDGTLCSLTEGTICNMTGTSWSFVMRHLLPWFSSYRANIAVRTNQTPPLGCLHLHMDIKWTFLVQMVRKRKRRKSKRNTLTSLTLQLSIKVSNSLLVSIMLEITDTLPTPQRLMVRSPTCKLDIKDGHNHWVGRVKLMWKCLWSNIRPQWEVFFTTECHSPASPSHTNMITFCLRKTRWRTAKDQPWGL